MKTTYLFGIAVFYIFLTLSPGGEAALLLKTAQSTALMAVQGPEGARILHYQACGNEPLTLEQLQQTESPTLFERCQHVSGEGPYSIKESVFVTSLHALYGVPKKESSPDALGRDLKNHIASQRAGEKLTEKFPLSRLYQAESEVLEPLNDGSGVLRFEENPKLYRRVLLSLRPTFFEGERLWQISDPISSNTNLDSLCNSGWAMAPLHALVNYSHLGELSAWFQHEAMAGESIYTWYRWSLAQRAGSRTGYTPAARSVSLVLNHDLFTWKASSSVFPVPADWHSDLESLPGYGKFLNTRNSVTPLRALCTRLAVKPEDRNTPTLNATPSGSGEAVETFAKRWNYTPQGLLRRLIENRAFPFEYSLENHIQNGTPLSKEEIQKYSSLIGRALGQDLMSVAEAKSFALQDKWKEEEAAKQLKSEREVEAFFRRNNQQSPQDYLYQTDANYRGQVNYQNWWAGEQRRIQETTEFNRARTQEWVNSNRRY